MLIFDWDENRANKDIAVRYREEKFASMIKGHGGLKSR